MNNSFFSTFYLYKEHKQLVCGEPVEAFIQYKTFRIDLLSGERIHDDVEDFFLFLEEFRLNDYFKSPVVFHLFYELGLSCVGLKERLPSNKPLAIFIRYSKVEKLEIYKPTPEKDFTVEPLSMASFDDYYQKFQKTYQHLLDGDCYQLNLTLPFYMRNKQKTSPEEYMKRLWQDPFKIGAYAHATYIDQLGKLFLSNSPECLFQIKDSKILTMPIKGTLKVSSEEERGSKWKELVASKKDQAELFMISDLMRNDLTKFSMQPSRVLHKKYPLHVPGLLHQFSVIESSFEKGKNLRELVESLFPGGSITGAPKRRVMELINDIEKEPRGFYCGSTVMLYKNLKTASINIRSIEVDYLQNEFKYGSGGGVTLLSQAQEEFEEVLAKLKSFLLLLN